MAFEEIIIFKPMSSRPANSERYVICLNRNEGDDISNRLYTIWKQMGINKIPINLVDNVDTKFINYIQLSNQLSLDIQIDNGANIIKYLSGNRNLQIPVYNLYNCLIVWNLPDNIDKVV